MSLHHQAEAVIDLAKEWRSKGRKESPNVNTFQRLFVAASNVTREREDGCMNKIKIERAYKLREEEQKGRQFNIING